METYNLYQRIMGTMLKTKRAWDNPVFGRSLATIYCLNSAAFRTLEKFYSEPYEETKCGGLRKGYGKKRILNYCKKELAEATDVSVRSFFKEILENSDNLVL